MRSDDVVENNLGVKVGSLDMGLAYIKDEKDATVCEILGTGEVKGHMTTYLGQFEGFDYHDMKVVALYLLLIDPGLTIFIMFVVTKAGMLSEIEG